MERRARLRYRLLPTCPLPFSSLERRRDTRRHRHRMHISRALKCAGLAALFFGRRPLATAAVLYSTGALKSWRPSPLAPVKYVAAADLSKYRPEKSPAKTVRLGIHEAGDEVDTVDLSSPSSVKEVKGGWNFAGLGEPAVQRNSGQKERVLASSGEAMTLPPSALPLLNQ